MYAQLGTIQFELIRYFESVSTSKSYNYAENKRIGQKPSLQAVDDSLVEMPIKVQFHASFCNPKNELKKLEDAASKHQILPFIYGNGEYRGKYVINSINDTPLQTDNLGNVIALEADIKLQECLADTNKNKKQATKNKQIKKKPVKKTSTSKTGSKTTSLSTPPKTDIKKMTRS